MAIGEVGSLSSSRRSPYSVSGLLNQSRILEDCSSERVSYFERMLSMGMPIRNCTSVERVIEDTKPLALL